MKVGQIIDMDDPKVHLKGQGQGHQVKEKVILGLI